MAKDLTDTWLRRQLSASVREREDIADARQKGLTIRVAPTGLTWWFRTKVGGVIRRSQLGTYPQLSLADARRLAADASDVLRRDVAEPDARWITARRIELGIDAAPDEKPRLVRTMARWTFAQARDAYVAEVGRTRRPATARSYGEFMRHPKLRDLDGRPVSEITRQEIAAIVASVHASGGETQARNMAAAIRPMWTYLALDHVISNSGVTPEMMDRLKPPARSRVATGRRTEREPELAAIGRLLHAARDGSLTPVVSAAVELLVLTAQRRLTVVSARRSLFEIVGDRMVWTMPPEDLKSGDVRKGRSGEPIPEHELPLPPAARAAVDRMLAIETDGDWLFPQTRPRRKGDPVGHLHASTLTHALGELPGVDFSPHDIRRAFTSTIRAAGYPRGAAAIILDHAEGREGVTMRHYDRYRELDEKAEKLSVWSDALEIEVEMISTQILRAAGSS